MKICCLSDFKDEFEALKSKSTYKRIESELFSALHNKRLEELKTGDRLNGPGIPPYVKKRLGSGGFRYYVLILEKSDCLFLLFIHAKSGSKGSSNTIDSYRTDLLKKGISAIRDDDFYEVLIDEKDQSFNFIHCKEAAEAISLKDSISSPQK